MVRTISLLPLSASILSLVLVVTTSVAPRRTRLPAFFFLALNVSTFLWSFTYFLQLNWGHYADPGLAPVGSPDYILLWLTSLGVAGSPTYWFLFASATARSRFWTSPSGLVLAHFYLIYTMAVGVTNPWHHMFLRQLPNGLPDYGPLALPHFIGTFLLVGGGIYYLLKQALALHTRAGRRRAAMLALGAAVPLAGGILYTSRLLSGTPLPINPTPVLFPLLNVVLAYQVIRGGLAEIVPLSTLSSIMENTDAHLAYLDPDFTLISVNTPFVRRSGHSETELIGHNYFDLFPDSGRRELFQQVRDSGKSVERHGDASVMRGVGRAVSFWNWSLSPVCDPSGEMEGLVLSLTDVTDATRERELDGALSRLNMRMHAGFSADERMREVVAEASSALECESSTLVLQRDDEWCVMQRCERPEAAWEPFSEEDFPHLKLAIEEAKTLVADDVRTDERMNPTIMKALELRSVLAVPLRTDANVLGAVSFEVRSVRTTFSPLQIRFAEQFAAEVTQALENARLYESERRIAETLQESMLTLPSEIAGLKFAHFYRSATSSARVGGDFFDIFELDSERVAMVMGDVSGHGLDAAVLTSLIKNTIRATALPDPSPASVMARTNEIVYRQTEADVFATAFFAVLDRASGLLHYCSAGHPPPLLLESGGAVTELAVNSPLLGVMKAPGYERGEAELHRGDILLMYTDGLTEARSDGKIFGPDRLLATASALGESEPEAVVRTTFDTVIEFTEGNLADDVALLALGLS